MAKYGPTKLFERIDQICANHYGSSGDDIVAFVLEKNPGLEKYGILLPLGITIDLPVRDKSASSVVLKKQIFLWD